MSLAAAGVVAVGGAFGTAARAALEAATPTTLAGVPWTTFTINVVGSLMLGVLVELVGGAGRDQGRRRFLRLLLGTGVLGGFTTYSTFVAEALRLQSQGAVLTAVGYAIGSVVAGVSCAVVGIGLTRQRTRGRSR